MSLNGFGELVFENCRVPVENRLGEEGDGLAVAYSSSLLYGSANLTAVALGIHRALVNETVAFTTQLYRYGNPLCELQTIKQKLGQMQSRLMTARLAAYHAVHPLDRSLPVEVHAACGLFTGRPVERYLRDGHHIFAPGGTSDVQLLRLAEFAHEGIAVFGRAEDVRHQAARGRDAGGRDLSPSEHGAGAVGCRNPAAMTADKTGANVAELRRQAEQQFAVLNYPLQMEFAAGEEQGRVQRCFVA